jgi:hypothetical protein
MGLDVPAAAQEQRLPRSGKGLTVKLRKAVSLTVFLSFIVVAFTGLMLFITPQGRVAYWAGWTLFGLSKEQYGQLHTTFMVLFLAAGIWHIALNWKPITNYMKSKSREVKIFVPEFNLALAFTALFFVGTLLGIAPFGTLIDAGDGIKALWEKHEGSPPWGHAEESSLARFTRGLADWERLEYQRLVEIPLQDAIDSLRHAGFAVVDENQKVIEIAEDNGTTPKALMEVIRRAARPVESYQTGELAMVAATQRYPLPMSGLGRMTLTEYSNRYSLNLDSLLVRFHMQGMTLDPEVRLKDEADRHETDPESMIELLNSVPEG